MIKEIHLTNWKSFQDATLYFDPVTVLIGTNASGKSNVIDALDFLSRIARAKDLVECLAADNGDAFRGGVEWVALKGQKDFTLSVTLASSESTVDYQYEITVKPSPRPLIVRESLQRIKIDSKGKIGKPLRLFWTEGDSDDPAIEARLYNKKNGTPRKMQRGLPVLTQLQLASGSVKNEDIVRGLDTVWSALGKLFILNPIPAHMRGYSPKAEKLAQDASNLAGVIAALPSQQKNEIEKEILRYVRDLPEKDIQSLNAKLYGPYASDAMLICTEAWQSRTKPLTVDSRAMSDGTLRFIAIATALLTLPAETQLVIEEVDNGLHPSRSNLLLRMIREIGEKKNLDVLVSTHNPALLDALGVKMTPFVVVAYREKEKGCSQLTQLEDIKNLPKLMADGPLGAIVTSGALEKL